MTALWRICGLFALAGLAGCNGPQATALDYALGTQRDYDALQLHSSATLGTAQTGQPHTWATPRGSNGHVSTSSDPYQDRSGRPCRSLHQRATMPDQSIDRSVVACQESDQTWLVVEPDMAPEPRDAAPPEPEPKG